MLMIDNPRFPHTCEITRTANSDDPDVDDSEAVTVYKGSCRSSAMLITDSSGEVITSTRRLSIPMTLKDWKVKGIAPSVSDKVNVDKDGVAKEWGEIIDFLPNSLGTTIIYKFART